MDATSDHPTLTARALAAFVVSLALTGAYFALMFIVGLNRDSDIVRFHGAGVIGALTQGMSAVINLLGSSISRKSKSIRNGGCILPSLART
jgi:hypothetical protein